MAMYLLLLFLSSSANGLVQTPPEADPAPAEVEESVAHTIALGCCLFVNGTTTTYQSSLGEQSCMLTSEELNLEYTYVQTSCTDHKTKMGEAGALEAPEEILETSKLCSKVQQDLDASSSKLKALAEEVEKKKDEAQALATKIATLSSSSSDECGDATGSRCLSNMADKMLQQAQDKGFEVDEIKLDSKKKLYDDASALLKDQLTKQASDLDAQFSKTKASNAHLEQAVRTNMASLLKIRSTVSTKG